MIFVQRVCVCVESSAHFRSHVWGIRNRRCHICHSYKVRSTRQMICHAPASPLCGQKEKRRKLFIENYGVMCSQNSAGPYAHPPPTLLPYYTLW